MYTILVLRVFCEFVSLSIFLIRNLSSCKASLTLDTSLHCFKLKHMAFLIYRSCFIRFSCFSLLSVYFVLYKDFLKVDAKFRNLNSNRIYVHFFYFRYSLADCACECEWVCVRVSCCYCYCCLLVTLFLILLHSLFSSRSQRLLRKFHCVFHFYGGCLCGWLLLLLLLHKANACDVRASTTLPASQLFFVVLCACATLSLSLSISRCLSVCLPVLLLSLPWGCSMFHCVCLF